MAITDNRKPKEKITEDLKKITEDKPTEEAPEVIPEEEKKTPIEEEQKKEVIEEPETEEPDEEIEEEEPKEEAEEEEPTPKPKEKPVDYKQKFSASTQEALVQYAKNKKIVEAVDQASNLPEPTEEELRVEYPDWDNLTDFEKKIAKDNLLNKRKFNMVHRVVEEAKKIDEWVEKVDKFLEEIKANETYPGLEGRENAFRRFCLKPTRRGVDFEDLVKAFLYGVKPEIQHKGSLLETGTGGPKELKPKELTVDEIKKIRISDPKKYRELIKAGKIKIEI